MLEQSDNYQKLYDSFQWNIPERYNIGLDICDKWAIREPDRVALLHRLDDGLINEVTYGDLKKWSNQLANALRAAGVKQRDRIALLLPQHPRTVAAHIAIYKLGAIAVPIALQFGHDALSYRLSDSGAHTILTFDGEVPRINELRSTLPDLVNIVCLNVPHKYADLNWPEQVETQSQEFTAVESLPEDPALMIYTSGTTGRAKGALHGHQVLLGHLPGVQLPHNFLPQPGDLFWTPSDWAWAGGLLNCLFPCLHFGVPVVAWRMPKFNSEAAFALMEELGVRNTYMPPTALRLLRTVDKPAERFKLKLRSIGSGGESLGREVLHWAEEELGLTVNESYGQTECNLMLGSCAQLGIQRPGAIGKAMPGHEVAILGPKGEKLPANEIGAIAVKKPNPVMFLSYWNRPDATEEKFVGDWLITGDQGYMDEEDYVFFVGRDDDVITSAGYRIGPGEIEDCLLSHPAIALCAVVGTPDPIRTETVSAFVVLKHGYFKSQELTKEIQAFVKIRLAAHEYPRQITYLDDLPMTTTGKIIRRKLKTIPSEQ